MATCLARYQPPQGWPTGVSWEAVEKVLGDLPESGKLIIVVHSTHVAVTRRMWNVAAVLAALKAHFPPSSGARVVAWDASLTTPADIPLMTRLFSRASVVVTGMGLSHVHHMLLPAGAVVLDVESAGVAWEQLELQGAMARIVQSWNLTAYEVAQLRGGVLP